MVFWRDFIEQYWEQAPTVWRGLCDPGLITADELFETVVAMPSRSKSDRFWVAAPSPVRGRDGYTKISLDHFGPKSDDGSFDGFFARVQQGLNARPMGINIHQLQLANPDLWFRFRRFIRGLIDGTNELPTQQWEIDPFFGTYHTTPFGIHRDNASVFAFGVLGQRTYYFWPGDAFQPGDDALGIPDMTHITPYLQQAKRFDLGPGDMVYWPSSHWHVVASDGQPSVVVQISAYFGARLSRLMGQHVQRLLQMQFGRDDMLRTYSRCDTATELPQVLVGAQERLGQIWQDGILDDELQRFWLTHLTADGFTAIPPAQTDAQLDHNTPIAMRSAMDFAGTFRYLSIWDYAPLRQRVQALPPERWEADTSRSDHYAVHAHTRYLPLIYDHDMRHTNVTTHPLYDELLPLVQPLVDHVQHWAGQTGYAVRFLLLRLQAGHAIPSHADGGLSLPFVHRVHAPIITNPGVRFTVGGETRHLAEGEIWEINNMAVHAVQNNGCEDRVHLVLDWTTPALSAQHVQAWAATHSARNRRDTS